MKKIPITKVKIGNILAEDIRTAAGTMLTPKGTIVTESVLDLLSGNSIFVVVVEEEEIDQEPKNESYYDSIRASKEFQEFKEQYGSSVEKLKEQLNEIVSKHSDVDMDSLLKITLDVSGTCNKGSSIMDYMMNMREYDDSTFCHSLNVSLLCGVLADWLKWDEKDKNLARICGLLHDIGKLSISDTIVKKPGKLTEEEYRIMKQHPVIGYKILENQKIDLCIKNACLMHHEKCDGSGYPLGLKGNQLDRFTKLVTIVDIYDAMTAARVYRGPMSPFAVVSQFEKDGLQKYDPEMILCFLQNVANSFLNNKVTLSNGHEGKVIFINQGNLSRPTVLCGDEFVDLSANSNINIEKMS